jgi:hypothetical protein
MEGTALDVNQTSQERKVHHLFDKGLSVLLAQVFRANLFIILLE